MDDKKFVILIYSGMAGLVVGLLIFLYFSISSNTKRNKGEIDYENIKTINTDDKVFSSKRSAYEATDRDSFLSVREENINVDFSKLFKEDSQANSFVAKEKVETKRPMQEKKHDPKPNVQSYNSTASRLTQKVAAPVGQPLGPSSNASPPQGVSSPPQNGTKRREGFYSTGNSGGSPLGKASNTSSLRAVIHSRQEAYQGSTVKLRTTTSISLDGATIPSNTFIYGTASMGPERVKIAVSSIIFNNQLFRVDYTIFDRDGIEGVYVPGLLLHDIAKETSRDAISNIDLNVPYVGSVPVNVSRKKISEQKATLTGDYEVILKN